MASGTFPPEDERLYEVLANYLDAFDNGNDPHKEHDFGAFEIDDQRFFWKVDYYAPDMDGGSDDPADANKTTRVLTVMLAEEY